MEKEKQLSAETIKSSNTASALLNRPLHVCSFSQYLLEPGVWCRPAVLAFGWLRQEAHECKANVGYIVNLRSA